MANLFKQLSSLKRNIFGGAGNTGETKPPATRVQDIDLRSSPTGILGTDPFKTDVLNYPLDVQQNFQNGHYMLFYINKQDRSSFNYKNPQGKSLPTSKFETITTKVPDPDGRVGQTITRVETVETTGMNNK